VTEVVGVEPDLTPETLPLVDQYLRQMPSDAPSEARQLAIAGAGCYFGEVARRLLHGRWVLPDPAPSSWRVELVSCFLYFSPVGMAGEIQSRGESEEDDGSFATAVEQREDLHQMLAAAAPFSEDEYYSLSGRIDVLQLAADWLVGRRLSSGSPRTYSAEDYQSALPPRRSR
jgi:hypothetical protein